MNLEEEEEETIGLIGLGNVQLESDDEGHLNHENRAVTRKKLDGIKRENDKYQEQSYWEERFAEEESFEWLISFDKCKHQLLPHLHTNDRILIVGCGNSTFSADLYDSGYHNIVNIDFSGVLIERMKILHSEARPVMQWMTMDMTEMNFESKFDVVIDKAAMDALVVSEGDVWNPQESVIRSVDKMCFCVSAVLQSSNAKFLQISFNQPHFRTKYLMGYRADGRDCSNHGSHVGYCDRYNWTLSFESIVLEEEGVLETFLYVMTR